jgi:hypothetical protein
MRDQENLEKGIDLIDIYECRCVEKRIKSTQKAHKLFEISWI